VKTGLSELIGSWKTQAISPAQRLQLAQRGLQQVAPLPEDAAAAHGVLGQQAEHRHRGDALARAGFADQRDGAVLGDVEAHPGARAAYAAYTAHGLRPLAAAHAKGHLQVLDGQQRARHSSPRSLGSSASRSASVASENAVTKTAMKSVAVTSCHQ
jgi:hypothetical protein